MKATIEEKTDYKRRKFWIVTHNQKIFTFYVKWLAETKCDEINSNPFTNYMTTQQKLEKMLVDYGLFESQANAILEIAKPKLDVMTPNYHITFNRPASEYPDAVFAVLFISLKPIALEWIEANCPLAWFKPMFQ